MAEAAPTGYQPPVRLRCVKVYGNRIYEPLEPASSLADVRSDYWGLRVEPVPEDDLRAAAACAERGEQVTAVCLTHSAFLSNSSATQDYGDPLLVWVEPQEMLDSLKRRSASASASASAFAHPTMLSCTRSTWKSKQGSSSSLA